jgi:hypothetical protein
VRLVLAPLPHLLVHELRTGKPQMHGGPQTGIARRRGWDSNPRDASRRLAVFKTAPFNHSGTPPRPIQSSPVRPGLSGRRRECPSGVGLRYGRRDCPSAAFAEPAEL